MLGNPGARGRGLLCAAAAAIALAACTTSISSRVASAPGASAPIATTMQPTSGFAYTLPFAQFDIQTTRVLSSCPGIDNDTGLDRADIRAMEARHRVGQGPRPPDFDPETEIAFSLVATSARRFAPGTEVTLDYRELTAPTKTTNFAVTLHENGMLHTINASADDRTGPIVQSVVTGIARLALAASAIPAPSATPPACNEPYYSRFKELKRLEARIRAGTSALKRARAQLEGLEAIAALQGNLSRTEAGELVTARRNLAEATATLQEMVQQHGRLLAQVSIVSTHIWPRNPETTEALLDIPTAEATFLTGVIGDSLYRDWESRFRVTAALSLDRGAGAMQAGALPANARGPIYVTPAPGRLRLCAGSADDADDPLHDRAEACRGVASGEVLAEQASNLPQFAHFAQLPLRNGPFENNSLSAAFREDGTMAEAHFQSQRASAEAASAAFADIAGTVQSTSASLRADDEARETSAAARELAAAQAELTDLQRQRDILRTQAEITQLQDGSAASTALTQVRAQQELVEAQLALQRAQRELDTLRRAND